MLSMQLARKLVWSARLAQRGFTAGWQADEMEASDFQNFKVHYTYIKCKALL